MFGVSRVGDQTNPKIPFRLIQDPKSLRESIGAIQLPPNSWVGVDAERASGFRYRQRAYLIQFQFESGETWLVDPLLFDEEAAGKAALQELIDFLPGCWILHASTQDFPCLFELGMRPTRLFDTEVAAKLLGFQRVGLAALIQELLGVELAKEHSAADWSTRPLSLSMLGYAALDVQYLHALKASLESHLIEMERDNWADQEFQNLLGFIPKPHDPNRWVRLPGIRQARDKEVWQIAKSIWLAREDLAKELDLSPGRILPDKSIAEAAIMKPRTRADLASNSQFSGRMSRTKLDLWWSAIEKAPNTSVEIHTLEESLPNHRSWERKFPAAHARYLVIRPKILELAESLSILPEVLVSPEAIRALAFNPPQNPKDLTATLDRYRVREWQRDLVDSTLQDWLSGDLNSSSN